MPAPSRLRLGVLEGKEIITMGLIRETLPQKDTGVWIRSAVFGEDSAYVAGPE